MRATIAKRVQPSSRLSMLFSIDDHARAADDPRLAAEDQDPLVDGCVLATVLARHSRNDVVLPMNDEQLV